MYYILFYEEIVYGSRTYLRTWYFKILYSMTIRMTKSLNNTQIIRN